MASTQYEVVGACVTDIPVGTATGPMRTTVYKGARLSAEGLPKERLAHLLDVGLIRELGKGEDPVPVEGERGLVPAEQAGRKFTMRTPKSELVEHAVAAGDLSREDAEGLSLKDLQERYVKTQSEPSKGE